MSKKLEKIRKICMECGGEGKISRCCQAEAWQGKCGNCGRFCKTDYCPYCDGVGYLDYRVGDNIQVFICVWSPEELKDQLYHPKVLGDTKTYEGKIVEFEDEFSAWVKIKYHRGGLIKTGIDELEVI